MTSSIETLRQVPPFAPPAGFRWLRRGETVKSTDYTYIPDQPPREADSFSWSRIWLGTPVGLRSADLGDRGDSIRLPFCRPAPVTPLLKVDPNTGRRPPILGLHFGAWVWYEAGHNTWCFFSAESAAGPIGFAGHCTHYVEAGDGVNKPAPLRDDQRELRYLAAEKGSVKVAMAADVKSTLLFHASDSADVMAHHFVGLLQADRAKREKREKIQAQIRATLPVAPYAFSGFKYDVSTVPIDPPKKAKLPTHKIPHCPAGWRKLVAGETVLDTDLYWSPDNVWTSRLGTKRVGKPWHLGCRATIRKEGPRVQPKPTVSFPILQDDTPPQVENAIHFPAPTSPGEGYVFLKQGDRIEKGDEFWNKWSQPNRWQTTGYNPGVLVGGGIYRRKVPAADSPLVPGDGYRLLYDFEVPTDDDEFLNLVTSDTPSDVIKKDRYGRRCWESSRGYYARNSSEGLLEGTDTIAERRRGLGNLTPAQFAFRRKLLPTEQYLPGWRLLRPDEVLKAGDRFRRREYHPGACLHVIPDNVREYKTVGEFARHLGDHTDGYVLFYRNTSAQ
jgi:hypothetical protein